MTHNRPVYPPNMMGPPMATGIYQGILTLHPINFHLICIKLIHQND